MKIAIFALVLIAFVYVSYAQQSCECVAHERSWDIDCDDQDTMLIAFNYLVNNDCNQYDNCQIDSACQDSYYIVQSHHDYCLPDEVPTIIEQEFHEYEGGNCEECFIGRRNNPGKEQCPVVNCGITIRADEAYDYLIENGCSQDCSGVCAENYQLIRSFHDSCSYDDVSENIEKGIHEFEDICSEYECNVNEDDDDELKCYLYYPDSSDTKRTATISTPIADDDYLEDDSSDAQILYSKISVALLAFLIAIYLF
eukprot:TRINITY_DN1096_c1_g1_i1.p1 TRINITY_DN1096_c1_g1~~TRINITY_DN1096_c1_g1_i1.p1  ORF type:complete len:254 (+),score=49.89 TRINITY_DN1096_c1_g1_i1:36-797(+)